MYEPNYLCINRGTRRLRWGPLCVRVRLLVLRDAHVQADSETRPPSPVDGELVIDRAQILFIQVVA